MIRASSRLGGTYQCGDNIVGLVVISLGPGQASDVRAAFHVWQRPDRRQSGIIRGPLRLVGRLGTAARPLRSGPGQRSHVWLPGCTGMRGRLPAARRGAFP